MTPVSFTASFTLAFALSRVAAAAWVGTPFRPMPAPVPVPPAATSPASVAATSAAPPDGPAAALLNAGDDAVEAGNLEEAINLYERLARDYPNSPSVAAARRALKIISASRKAQAPAPHPVTDPSPPPAPAHPSVFVAGPPGPEAHARDTVSPDDRPASDDVIMRREPYSTRTSERLRLTSWEKLDFGVTAFLYGGSVGASYALGTNAQSDADVAAPVALGALLYTLGAVAYLQLADPDRADLPLALAITSYIPTTTLLAANLASDHPDPKTTSLAVAAAGLFSVPIAVLATRKLDLDPGDTQLVRDAGFWGLVLATAATMGFGGTTMSYPGLSYTDYQSPSAKSVSGMGLLGLYGGLGLGLLAAANSEVSLERVRVTTWGGYGGALLGTLLGVGAKGNNSQGDQDVYRGAAIGALAGLIVTFVTTSGLDGIPSEGADSTHAAARGLTPAFLTLSGAAGQTQPGLGLAYVMP